MQFGLILEFEGKSFKIPFTRKEFMRDFSSILALYKLSAKVFS